MGASWRRIWVDVPDNYSRKERQAAGEAMLEVIRKRTQSGKDKNGRDFVGYTQAYKESHEYKLKRKKGKVDLTLTGDMLASLEVLSSKKGAVMLGYKNGTDENAKADGHISGNVRKDGRKRDFLGIQKKESTIIFGKIDKVKKRAETLKALIAIGAKGAQ